MQVVVEEILGPLVVGPIRCATPTCSALLVSWRPVRLSESLGKEGAPKGSQAHSQCLWREHGSKSTRGPSCGLSMRSVSRVRVCFPSNPSFSEESHNGADVASGERQVLKMRRDP